MPALFYHVTQSRLEAVAASLLARATGQGWRVLLRVPSPERAQWYDERLWMEHDFLPHGVDGGPHDALQPVLVTPKGTVTGFNAMMSVEGADVDASEIGACDRVWIVFDGRDPMAVEHARTQWRTLTGAGVSAQYWSEESGRWEKKAET